MKVAVGQIWEHVPSGDVRTVLAITTYRERVGVDPGDFEHDFGITHVATMGSDRRDSWRLCSLVCASENNS